MSALLKMKTPPTVPDSFTTGPRSVCRLPGVVLWGLPIAALFSIAVPAAGWAAAAPVSNPAQKPAIPDTPAGRVFSEWLEIFNRGDSAAMARFWDQRWLKRSGDVKPEIRQQRDEEFRKKVGESLEFESVNLSTPTRFMAVVRAGNTAVLNVLFDVEAAPPHRVTQWGAGVISPPVQSGGPPGKSDGPKAAK